ncbi:hypothetical protein PIB30_010312 [Stylosanthes scabra]|uniref:Uncharacterized protein n=1 Tax=Stylosanthes scabra TaxID=79078 RepID=A0ABU6U5P1_9FABA|nr:hypothetical protein [Stylosanthes scabra]
MEGRLKFEEPKTEMKVDTEPFEVNSSFSEPELFGVNVVGFQFTESDIIEVHPVVVEPEILEANTLIWDHFHIDHPDQPEPKILGVNMAGLSLGSIEDHFCLEPGFLSINMAGFHSLEFDTALGDFEADVRKVFPGGKLIGSGLKSSKRVLNMRLVVKFDAKLLEVILELLVVVEEANTIEAEDVAVKISKASLTRGHHRMLALQGLLP